MRNASVVLIVMIVMMCGGLIPFERAQAYLLEKDPDADASASWERVEKREYQLEISMGGGTVLYPDDKYDLPFTLALQLIGVPGLGNPNLRADLGHGRGAWSKIHGERRDADNKTSITITGLFLGLQVTQNIMADEDTLSVDYRVRVATPTPKIGFCYFGQSPFVRRPEGLVFKAETQDGKKISGDLCLPFEKTQNLKLLEIRTARKIIVYDFGTADGVELQSTGTPPPHPTVALLMIRPQDVRFDKIGETVGYCLTIKLSPAS